MKYTVPKRRQRTTRFVKHVTYRIPTNKLGAFNDTLLNSNLSAQKLVDSMVGHCLREVRKRK